MSPDSERFANFGAEAGDFVHLLGVWLCLTFPLAGLGSFLVETLSISGLSEIGGGLLFGTLVVAGLEVVDRRPSLGRAGTFLLTNLVLSVAAIPLVGPTTDALGATLGEAVYSAETVGLAALLTFTRLGTSVWAAGERLTQRLLRVPEREQR